MRRYHDAMQFYLGVHQVGWLARTDVPLFLSRRRLAAHRGRLPRARGPWALDSGGFTELSRYGRWTVDVATYVEEVRRFRDSVGQLAWAACQDWMCEPQILALTGLTVEEHQRRTVANYLALVEHAPEIPWVPAVQGWTRRDYHRCIALYEAAGVSLHTLPLVGIGTVCRRQHMPGAERIVQDLYDALGPRLHGFGVKLDGLRRFHTHLQSADSTAWSFKAKRDRREVEAFCPAFTGLKNAQNRLDLALAWRERVLEIIDPYPIRREWAARASTMTTSPQVFRFPALAVRQGPHTFYQFSLDGKLLPLFVTVSRARRDAEGIAGYQRPEIASHIAEIRRYVERPEAVIPNSITLAFDERARFTPLDAGAETAAATGTGETATLGFLEIPADPDRPVGWIVDGQQRMAAVRDAAIERFTLPCTAFIGDILQQCEQFIRVNSTRPLPKPLIYELVPQVTTTLPQQYERKRLGVELQERLNHDADSPFCGAIRTPTCPAGRIKDNSLLKMVETSAADGALSVTGGFDEALALLKAYWRAVAATWPEAWALPPAKSRLTHGVGILGMGAIMDEICDEFRRAGLSLPTDADFRAELARIATVPAWTTGLWPNDRKWNEYQNTTQHIAEVRKLLERAYRDATYGRQLSAPRPVAWDTAVEAPALAEPVPVAVG